MKDQLLEMMASRQTDQSEGDGMTFREIHEVIGGGEGQARTVVRQMVADGKLESVKIVRPSVHGIRQTVFGYRVPG